MIDWPLESSSTITTPQHFDSLMTVNGELSTKLRIYALAVATCLALFDWVEEEKKIYIDEK